MITKGTIERVEAGRAAVRISLPSHGKACPSCSGGLHGTMEYVTIPDDLDVEAGDRITMEVSSRSVLFSAFMFFFLPLVMFIIGLSLADPVMRSIGREVDGGFSGVALGFILMTVAFIAAYLLEKRNSRSSSLAPRIVSIERHSDRKLSAPGNCCHEPHGP